MDGIIILATLFFAFMGVLVLWEAYFDHKHDRDAEKKRLHRRINHELYKIWNER